MHQKLFNAGWLTVEQMVRLITGFGVMLLIARQLGPDGFAAYAYVFSLVGLFIPIASFGLEPIIMRRVAGDPASRDLTLGTALAIRGVTALFGAGACISAALIWEGPAGATLALSMIAGVTILVNPSETFTAFLVARERMKVIALPRTFIALTVAAVTIALVCSGMGLAEFLVLRSCEAALLAVAAAISYAFVGGTLRSLQFDRALAREMLREAAPLAMTVVATQVYLRIDQVMLGQMADTRELGLYGLAARIVELANFVPTVLQATFYASLVRSHEQSPEGFDYQMQRIYDIHMLAAWGVILVLGAGSAILLQPVFGVAYGGAMPMIMILLLAVPFFYLFYAWGNMLTVRGWFWIAAAATVFGAVANIALNLVFIPRYGANGAAWATVISYFLAGLGASFMITRLRPAAIRMTRSLNPIGALMRIRALYLAERDIGSPSH